MIKKAYHDFKNDIEKQRLSVLLTEILVFIASWAYFCFLYAINPIEDIYSSLMLTSPYITTTIITFFSETLIICFILRAAAMGEVISRFRNRTMPHE